MVNRAAGGGEATVDQAETGALPEAAAGSTTVAAATVPEQAPAGGETPAQAAPDGRAESPDMVTREEMERQVAEAHMLVGDRVKEKVDEALLALATEFEADSVEALREKIKKLSEVGRQHALVLAQLEAYRKEVEEILSLGHTPASLPSPLPGEDPKLTVRFQDRVSPRIRMEPQKDLNIGASPIIHQTFEQAITKIQARTGLKRQGLKKQLGSLAILLLYTAMENVPDDAWVSVSPLRDDPTGESILLDDLAQLLIQRIVAKPEPGAAAPSEQPAAQDAAASSEE